ncbi:MAG: hypothetical protein GY792_33905 [Gammaproteobacteria bacterium]|nr:hypothetical protein [Gammaproteobacteria bacterium]
MKLIKRLLGVILAAAILWLGFLRIRQEYVYEWVEVTHSEYQFSFSYPTKWEADLYGERGYRGNSFTKAYIYDGIYSGPWIRIEVIPLTDPTLAKIKRWYQEERLSTFRKLEFYRDDIEEQETWRAREISENRRMREYIYIFRENDFLIITITADQYDYERDKADFETLLVSFETVP